MMMQAQHIPNGPSPKSGATTTSAPAPAPASAPASASASSPGPSPQQQHSFNGSSFGAVDAATALMSSRVTLDGQAPRACEKCRASKRKCDKKLPFCDRCTRLNAKCHYVQDPIVSNPSGQGAQVVFLQSHSLTEDALFHGSPPLEGITISQILSLISGNGGPSEADGDWRASVTLYLHCVHPWYAVVHPALFNRQLASLCAVVDSPSPPSSQSSPYSNAHVDQQVSAHNGVPVNQNSDDLPSKELALLVVAMHLLTRMRLTDAGEQHMFDELYRTAKRLLSLLLMGCAGGPQPTIELVQCGALFALYEYGHGDPVMSYRTLSQTATMARVLGIKPGHWCDVGGGEDEVMSTVEEEQSGCLWWGMFILEQFIHQEEAAKQLPFILETPNRQTLLPDTPPMTPPSTSLGSFGGSAITPPPPSSLAVRHVSTGIQVGEVKLGSYQISAKASSLFHRALQFDKERNLQPGTLASVASFDELDKEIRHATQTLLVQSLNWEMTLDSFAMLISALFTLYLPYLSILEHSSQSTIAASYELTTALTALRFACKMSTDISCKVNHDYESAPRSPVVLCAPAGATCYHVIVAFSRLSRIFPAERNACHQAIAEKFESLRLFSFRWGIAEKMMSQLEQKTGLDRGHYLNLNDPSISPPARNAHWEEIGR